MVQTVANKNTALESAGRAMRRWPRRTRTATAVTPHGFPYSSSASNPRPRFTRKTCRSSTLPAVAHYSDLLDSCLRSKSASEAQKVHRLISASEPLASSLALLEKVMLTYISLGEIVLARRMFEEIPCPNVFLYNALIRAYSWSGPLEMALELYYRMAEYGIAPNKFTFPFVLKACSALQALSVGEMIHEDARRLGLDSDLYVSTALIDLYMKCGCLDEAHDVFEKMGKRDVVAWNAMVAGYALHGMYNSVVGFVLDMQKQGRVWPNASTMVSVLPLIAQEKQIKQGMSIHTYCLRRFFCDKDVLVTTALLDMYAKCDNLVLANRIFTSMSTVNEVTWSAVIGGHVICNRMVEALHLFKHSMSAGVSSLSATSLASVFRACANMSDLSMGAQLHAILSKSGFLRDLTAGNSLLSMYAKADLIDEAMQLFNEADIKDSVTYSAFIAGCVQNGKAEKAFHVFKKMQQAGVSLDNATMIGMIPACSHLADLQQGKCCHGSSLVHGLMSDLSICNALIDMYAKCGRLDLSRKVFDTMQERDIVSWNTLSAAYGIHGLGREAISLLPNMESTGLVPDDITFICLLSACSHSGLVAEGERLFSSMEKYGIIPRMDHYICMVDLLGRGGSLEKAFEFVRKMPLEPDARVWGALLGSCQLYKNIELGREVSGVIQKTGNQGTGSFVLLSNMYSSTGRYNEAAKVRIVQKNKGFMKSPGCSWIETYNSRSTLMQAPNMWEVGFAGE